MSALRSRFARFGCYVACGIWFTWSCIVGAAAAAPPSPEVIELSGETPDKPILCSVYRPDPLPEAGKAGLVIHLYGHHGTHLEHNAGRKPYDKLRKLLAERGYYLVVPNLGLSHWMNNEAVENVDRVIDQMVSKYGVDPKQVNLLGSSMGGGGSLVYVTRRPGKIRSVVSVFPMIDYRDWEKERGEGVARLIVGAHGGDYDKRDELLRDLSPTEHLDAFSGTAVYLLHGDKDETCLLSHSQKFAKQLREKGYPVILQEVPGAGHSDTIMEDYQIDVADFLTGQKK